MHRSKYGREHLYTIESKSDTISGAGDVVTTWSSAGSVWISSVPMKSGEVLRMGGQLNEYWWRGKSKFNTALTHKSRLVKSGQYYSVESVVDPTNDSMTLDIVFKLLSNGAD